MCWNHSWVTGPNVRHSGEKKKHPVQTFPPAHSSNSAKSLFSTLLDSSNTIRVETYSVCCATKILSNYFFCKHSLLLLNRNGRPDPPFNWKLRNLSSIFFMKKFFWSHIWFDILSVIDVRSLQNTVASFANNKRKCAMHCTNHLISLKAVKQLHKQWRATAMSSICVAFVLLH